jgi:hypothetical protein
MHKVRGQQAANREVTAVQFDWAATRMRIGNCQMGSRERQSTAKISSNGCFKA